jgi:hypothetical protein
MALQNFLIFCLLYVVSKIGTELHLNNIIFHHSSTFGKYLVEQFENKFDL